ncbi:hypothetical protein CJF32_00009029 [Rutstroemia sp. NJR-2017a WRK4]|nr:hypothetical protein CJF32_00009029 [Rutstroemia sp. NJR-2017a WRK4]
MASGGVSITVDNLGPWVNIVVWILLVTMCLATFIKLFIRWTMAKNFAVDDLFMVLAMILTIGYDVAVSTQVSAGLGQHHSVLSESQIVQFQKELTTISTIQAIYASEILLVLSLCTAKLVLLQFLRELGRHDMRRKVVDIVFFLTITIYLILLFPVAFQCPAGDAWEVLSPRCFNQHAFWVAFAIIDIMTDLSTICLPIYLLHDIRLKLRQKIGTIAAFSTRIWIIPITIVRIVYINRVAQSNDHTYEDFYLVMVTSCLLNASVAFTVIPFLNPIMDGLQTNILTGELRSMATSSRTHGSMGYQLKEMVKNRSEPSSDGSKKSDKRWAGLGHSGTHSATAGGNTTEDIWRRSSSASDKRMIINQSTTVAVQFSESDEGV